MAFIGCGGWIYYYYFLIGSSALKVLKDDIFGFGKSFQIFNNLIISKHKFMILFLNYFSEFFFGLIVCLYIFFKEKYQTKRKNKYKDLENNITKEINNKNKQNNKNKKRNSIKQEMQVFTTSKNNITDNEILTNELNQNLINEDNFTNKEKEEKIGEKINKLKNIDNSQQNIKKYELIYNNLYEDITESSYANIILSSFLLIVNDVIMKWIFSSNEIFDYFFFNILIMTLIFKFHYKEKIYSHQRLGLVIILFISGALFIACLFEDIDFTSNPKTIWEAFDENHDMVFIFIAIYLGASTCSCYGIIIQKKIMDNQFIYPYKIICLKGIIGMIISAILIVISTLIPCKNNQYVNFKIAHFLKIESNDIFNISNLMSVNNTNSSVTLFECVDSYNNEIYFDNFISYFNGLYNNNNNKDKYLEIFLYIPIYLILHFLTNIFLILVNKLLSPIHCLMVDSFYRIFHIMIQSLQNYDIQDQNNIQGIFYEIIIQPFSTQILRIIAYFISIIGYIIYLEIIELKFCGLNKNTRKNIRKRAKSDGKEREKMGNYSETSSDFVEEESEENESVKSNKK